MSHEGGPEPGQRTVAELLAKYGQETGERAPRRRRRRAEDMEDTGAQAIIDRVLSESGEMAAISDDTPRPERTSHRQQRTEFQRPVEPPRRRQQPPPQPPPPPPPSSGPPTVATNGPLVRPTPPAGPPPSSSPSSSPRMPAVAQPPESTRPVRGERQTGPQPAVRPPQQPPGRRQQPSQPLPAQPPAQSQPLPKPQQPSQQLRKPPPGQRSGIQPSMRSRPDGDAGAPQQPTQMMPPAPPPEPMTEELPRVPTYPSMEPAADPRHPGEDSRTRLTPAVQPHDPYASGPQPRVPDREDDYAGYPERDFDSGYADYGGDLDQGYGGIGRELDDDLPADLDGDRDGRDEDGDRAYDDLDRDLEDEDLDATDDEADAGSRSAVREWLIMAGQLAVGVVGGAAVWLGFNWLWGALPQAALVAALVVIAGMVFIVRKIRRAEDLQTTVYAVLVGLLATVSPAALLLLNR
ncbi:hypothetical protein [Actinophytocola gossypii]|uniref:Uncharacterized protein n=1 Tax=Actinophytocola gossypii TaxID=2812003 RepID=A0ABT2JCT1_9PSEU|nr:hypothetical protein [Actinophytocola gossypii]MCT2585681.1 hypothetical protein [Actinophytocola gossypii]